MALIGVKKSGDGGDGSVIELVLILILSKRERPETLFATTIIRDVPNCGNE